MHEVIAKIAHFAVSKAAGFCYAVAVGVAANLAFHFVQPHEPVAVVAMAPPAPQPTVEPTASASATTAVTAPMAPPAAALPVPALKPTALPPTALPSEAALHPLPAPTGEPAPTGRLYSPPPAAALPPLGPAIEVAAPPTPPPPIPAPAARSAALPYPEVRAATAEEPPGSLEFSDVWHPNRAVKKGLHWVGEQVPVIGDSDAGPLQPRAAPSAAPISLLPPAPRKPGPGSGGLY